jgi:hypothetical protein
VQEGARKVKDKKLIAYFKRIWKKVGEFFRGVKNEDKDHMMELIEVVSKNFYIGQNADAISLTPKKGYKKVYPNDAFKHNPTAVNMLKRIFNIIPESILTGSVALAASGDVYRKGIGDLHDLDMLMPKGTYKDMESAFVREFPNAYKIWSFYVDNYLYGKLLRSPITSYIVPPEGHMIVNLRKTGEYTGKIKSYQIMGLPGTKDAGKIVGSYSAEIERDKHGKEQIKSEDFGNGLRAIMVDLMFQHKDMPDRERISYRNKYFNKPIDIATPQEIFRAKKLIGDDAPRTKDIMDYNLYEPNIVDVESDIENVDTLVADKNDIILPDSVRESISKASNMTKEIC